MEPNRPSFSWAKARQEEIYWEAAVCEAVVAEAAKGIKGLEY
jgi:hypothetical protein